jgi:hypothetical protein
MFELLQQMSNRSDPPTDQPMSPLSGPPVRGRNDKEVNQVKARLYRTAFAVSIVAILLEGLGAGWKWG